MLRNNISHIYTIGSAICLFIFSIIIQSKQNFNGRNGLFIKYRPKKKCIKCSGFGIIRCVLCRGKGLVSYERKYLRLDPCPKCLQKRFDICSFCKGIGERTVYGDSNFKNRISKTFRLFNLFNLFN